MSEEAKNFTQKFTKKIKGLYIDPAIFTFKFSCNCPGECCHYGVFIDYKEYENILSIKDRVIALMDETQCKDPDEWFEPEQKDEDFESGITVGTEVINNKCVFLDKNGLCTLQRLAIEEGEFQWKYKPIYCVLFPLTTYEGALTLDDEHLERLENCNVDPNNNLTMFEACREELKHFLGEEGFAELEAYREEYLNEINIGEQENVSK